MKEPHKIGLLVFGAVVFYVGWMILYSIQPPVGYRMARQYHHDHPIFPLQVGAAFAQEAQAPAVAGQTYYQPREGTIVTDPNTGKQYSYGAPGPVWPVPSGYHSCLPNRQLTRQGNVDDARASHPCINGGPVGSGCPEVVWLLCNPTKGRQVEMVGPDLDAEGHVIPPTYRDPATGQPVTP